MSDTKKPSLLTLREIQRPLESTQSKLTEVIELANSGVENQTVLRGLFVLSNAYVEHCLAALMALFLHAFPLKIGTSNLKFEKQDIIGHATTEPLVSRFVRRKVRDMSYQSFYEYIGDFKEILSLNEPQDDDDNLLSVREIRETRNLLLHNDLIVNEWYVTKSGPRCRNNKLGSQLSLDADYFQSSVSNLLALIVGIEAETEQKYARCTKIAALRRLWDYLFSSPIMRFDDYWEVDEEGDKVWAYKKPMEEEQISSSEKMVLGMLRAHFNNNPGTLDGFNMNNLDEVRREKLIFLLTQASRLRSIFS